MGDVLQQLHDDRKHVIATVEDMIKRAEEEKRDLTTKELAEVGTLKEQVKSLEERIEAREAHEDATRWVVDKREADEKPRRRIVPAEDVGGEPPDRAKDEIRKIDERFLTCGTRKIFTRDNFGEDADHYGYRAGQWWLAVNGRPAAKKWCEGNGIDYEARALQGNTATAGGVLVPLEVEQAIIIQREQYGVARRECRIWPMGSDKMSVPRSTNSVTVYYPGEGGTATESDSTFDQIQLTTIEPVAYMRVANTLAEDAIINIGDFVADEFAYAFAKAEDEALFNGDGTSTYGGTVGIRSALVNTASLAGAVDAASNHDLITEIDIDDLLPVLAVVPEYALDDGNAKWYCSPAFWSLVFLEIAEAGGGQTFQTYEGGMRRMFLGYPVVVTPSMPNASATDYSDVVMCLFGDMRQAVAFGDRRGISVLASGHRHIEYRQTTYLGSERYAINAHGIGTTSAAGPMVALVGE